MPTVSVLIACYNHGVYLPDAVQSVARQTFSDWEVIIVDDGSTDNSLIVAMTLESDHAGKIHVISQENRGQAAARQVAFERAKGTYAIMLDADDMLEPDMMQACVTVFENHPNVDVVVGDAWVTGESLDDKLYSLIHRKTPPWPEVLYKNPYGVPAALMFRHERAGQVGGLDAGMLDGSEDWDLWSRLTRAGCRFYTLKKFTCRYRKSEDSYSSQSLKMLSSEKMLFEFARHEDERLSEVLDAGAPISSSMHQQLNNAYVLRAFAHTWVQGGNTEDLTVVLRELHRGELSIRMCHDQLVEGLQLALLAGRDVEKIPKLPQKEIRDLLQPALEQKGLSHHGEKLLKLVERMHADPGMKPSWKTRIAHKLQR